MKMFKSILTVMFLLFATVAWGDVNLLDGNYSLEQVDAKDPLSSEAGLQLKRNYNSQNTHSGLFGPGWSTLAEKRLQPVGDGAILVFEQGDYKPMRFYPEGYSTSDIRSRVDAMLVARKSAQYEVPETFQRLREELLASPEKRDELWQELLDAEQGHLRQFSAGTRFVYQCEAKYYLIQELDGYIMHIGGRKEYFNTSGQLVAVTETSGAELTFDRDAQGTLQQIVDRHGRRMIFNSDGAGRVTQVMIENGQIIKFSYNTAGYLLRVLNEEGLVAVYDYDDASRMSVAPGNGGSDEMIKYYANGKVQSVNHQHSSGLLLEYTYERQGDAIYEGMEQHLTVIVKKRTGPEGPFTVAENRYNYTLTSNQFGSKWRSNAVVDNDQGHTETDYLSECKPLWTNKNGQLTKFSYDAECRLVGKETETWKLSISYDERWGKISHVSRLNLSTNEEKWSRYTYNQYGDLQQTENERGRLAVLAYNDMGQISSMANEDGSVLHFTYNSLGKPSKIVVSGIGTIEVAYNDSGEIDSVESSEGHKVALQVTRMFQQLLALIKPAGVNFD